MSGRHELVAHLAERQRAEGVPDRVMAARLGLAPSSWNQIRRGRYQPGAVTLTAIAAVLDGRPVPSRANWRRQTRLKWTPARLAELDELIRQGLDDGEIARRLGVTPVAIQVARKRHRLPPRTRVLLSAGAVARRLGVPCAKTVAWWIGQGWLRGQRGQRRGPNRQWHVDEENLYRFLADRRYWHLWTPERIPDPALREWTQELRAGVRFLTTGEVAERLGVVHAAVQQWIADGRLPAVRRANWLVRAADLEGFVPPCERTRRGRALRRFSDEEDALLLALRAEGYTWQQIARRLGRPLGSVYGRYQRMVEQGVEGVEVNARFAVGERVQLAVDHDELRAGTELRVLQVYRSRLRGTWVYVLGRCGRSSGRERLTAVLDEAELLRLISPPTTPTVVELGTPGRPGGAA